MKYMIFFYTNIQSELPKTRIKNISVVFNDMKEYLKTKHLVRKSEYHEIKIILKRYNSEYINRKHLIVSCNVLFLFYNATFKNKYISCTLKHYM